MSEVWYTPNGEEVSTIRARITATGVALLMAYVVTLSLLRSTGPPMVSPHLSSSKTPPNNKKISLSPRSSKPHECSTCMQSAVNFYPIQSYFQYTHHFSRDWLQL
jgi:hypothetical protein